MIRHQSDQNIPLPRCKHPTPALPESLSNTNRTELHATGPFGIDRITV
jgi:hypothetical protein